MASTHKHIRSGTANKRPTTAIADGQIALNTNLLSPGLFFKDSTGAVILKIGPVHVGVTAPNASPAGSAGNSTGEIWLDTSLTPVGVKIWNGSAFVNATPIGSTTVQGLLELATNAETQAGADTARAVTSASLQSKLSDSTSTTSATTIASSTAVKAAYDLANAALPKTGGTVTGNLEIGTAGSLSFEGATADGFETTIAVVNPTADRTITLPNTTGTVVTTGDTGTVTSTMLLDGTIVNADINASAEIAVSKLADGSARQLLQTDAAGTGVEWASNIDIPGTLDVTSAATFDSTVAVTGALTKSGSNVVTVGDTGTVTSTMILDGTILNADVNASAAIAGTKISPDFGAQTIVTTGVHSAALGAAATPSITFTGDLNTGIYSPGADQVAVATNGVERVEFGTSEVVFNDGGANYDFRVEGDTSSHLLFVDASTDRVGVGTSSPGSLLHLNSDTSDLFVRMEARGANALESSFLFQTKNSAGTNTGGSIGYDGNTNTLYLTGATTGGATQHVAIDSSGRVGIGTTSPLALFDAKPSSNRHVLIVSSASYADNGIVATNDAGSEIALGIGGTPIQFFTGATERARIDSSGRLLVGTSTGTTVSAAGSTLNPFLQLAGTSSNSSAQGIYHYSATSGGAAGFVLAKSSNATLNTQGLVSNGHRLGYFSFNGSDGAVFTEAARIEAFVDGTPGAGDMPGRLVFSTTADGASSPTERMRITNGGAMLQGNTSDLTGVLGTGLKVKSNAVGSDYSAAALCLQGTGGDFYAIKFADQDMGVLSVTSGATDYIQIGGSLTTATLYSNGLVQLPNVGTTASAANVFMNSGLGNQLARSTSSLRYKTDIEDLDTYRADAALSLRPVWYRSKATADRKDWSHYGLIAEEVAEIEPRLVNWTYLEDEYITVTNEYGIESKELKPNAKLVPDGVQYERLSVLLLSVIQRQEKRIEYLEAEIAEVKAQLA